jgi:hypothetical protein
VTDSLEVLNGEGHLTLTWDPAIPAEVAKARDEVERLRAAGYSFFAVVGSKGADEVEAGNGTLLVERIADPIRPPPAVPAKKPQGRPPKNPPPEPDRRTVAVRPMAGG